MRVTLLVVLLMSLRSAFASLALAQEPSTPIVYEEPGELRRSEGVPVTLEATAHGVAFHLVLREASREFLRIPDPSGQSWRDVRGMLRTTGYDALCQAPCEISLPPGPHLLALSRPGGLPMEAGVLVVGSSPLRVRGTYVDQSGLRAAGAVVLTIGALAAAALMAGGAVVLSQRGAMPAPTVEEVGWGLVGAGCGTVLLGFIMGLAMGMAGDGGRIEF